MENNLSYKRRVKLSSQSGRHTDSIGWDSWLPPTLSLLLCPAKIHNFKIDECSVLGQKMA